MTEELNLEEVSLSTKSKKRSAFFDNFREKSVFIIRVGVLKINGCEWKVERETICEGGI